jgi:hypothetical protein
MRSLTFLFIALLLITTAAPLASATHVNAIILTSKPGYEVGETLEVTLHIFKAGERWDPDETPTLKISMLAEPVLLNMSRVGKGLYSAEYTLTPESVAGNASLWWAHLRAQVKDWYRVIYAEAIITIRQGDVAAWVEVSNPNPAVGEEVEVTVTTLRQGVTADPENITLVANPIAWHWTSDEEIELERRDVGVYTGRYTIPEEVAGVVLYFISKAVFEDYTVLGGAEARVRGMSVWYHRLASNSTSLTFEMIVSDAEDRPAAGAIVRLYWDGDYEAVTDEGGRAVFEVPLSGRSSYWIRGNITYQGGTQKFYTPIFVNEGLSVRPLVDSAKDLVVEPGSEVNMTYEVVLKGEPLRNASLQYYLSTSREVMDFGTVMTDDQGLVFVNLTIPDRSVKVALHYDSQDGRSYGIATYLFVQRPDFRIDVDRLQLGEVTTVRVTIDASFVGIPPRLGLTVLPFEEVRTDYDWLPILLGEYYLPIYLPLPKRDGVKAYVFLPSSLPTDAEYLLMAWMGSVGEPSEVTAAYLRPGEGTGGSITGPGAGLWPLNVSIFGVPLYGWMIAAVGPVAAVWAFRRWRRGPPVVEQEVAPQEAVSHPLGEEAVTPAPETMGEETEDTSRLDDRD